MTMRKRIIWILVLAGVIGLVGAAMRPHPMKVDVATVSKGPLKVTIDEEARTQVKRRYTVSAPLAGKLLRVELKAGDRVDEGTVLARLVPADAPLLDPRARAEQEARLHASEAAVAQADANVTRARVADTSAREDLQRKQKLGQGGAISPRELDMAGSDAATRTQELASAEFGAKVAAHQLAEARAALQRGRSGRVDEFEILAPAPGRVLRVLRESEGVVTAGTNLIEVGDPGVLEVVADLLTVEAVRVRPGMPAFIDHWGGARALEAKVRSIDPSGFTKVSALGVEEQRVKVTLDPVGSPADWQALGDGYRVEVHVVVWEAPAVLRVPTAALFRRGDAWFAFAVDGNKVVARRLDIGEQSEDLAELRGGLKDGDRVVLRPGEALRDGVRVEAVAAGP
jgi:HlyD family secretion protein